METIKQINIKNRTYYFYNDIINLDEFDEIRIRVDEKIDISDGIDVDMSDKSKECMLCHYWYFLIKNFSYGPYSCDGCYNMMQKCDKLRNIAIVHIKENVYRIYFLYMSKLEAKKLMPNSNLIDKKGIL